MNLVRLKIHYMNCNEDSLLKMLRARYAIAPNTGKFSLSIFQRRLNIRIHNTWKDVAPVRSIALAEPVEEGEGYQVCEACANVTLGKVYLDPLICLYFELVVEVQVETDLEVHRDFVTLATFPYCPKITITRLKPAEIVDDFILQTV